MCLWLRDFYKWKDSTFSQENSIIKEISSRIRTSEKCSPHKLLNIKMGTKMKCQVSRALKAVWWSVHKWRQKRENLLKYPGKLHCYKSTYNRKKGILNKARSRKVDSLGQDLLRDQVSQVREWWKLWYIIIAQRVAYRMWQPTRRSFF